MEAMEGREMFSVTDLIIDPMTVVKPAATTTLTADGDVTSARRNRVTLLSADVNRP
jgi:hypothetical protein